MNISDNDLKNLIIQIIKQLQQEESMQYFSVPNKKMFIVLDDEWKEQYLAFFYNLPLQKKYDIKTVISPLMNNETIINKIKQTNSYGDIIIQNDISFDDLSDFITVFPIVPRSLISKTALCISDTFQSKWIENCITKDEKVIMIKSGIEGFSGKEPKKYIQKIKGYYEDIIDYGILITDDIFEFEKKSVDLEVKEESINSYETNNRTRRVITEQEIEQFKNEKKVVLYQGDIITALAIEKASTLGIDIIRK